MDQWKGRIHNVILRNNLISGHFDQIRSTETEELQTQSDDDEVLPASARYEAGDVHVTSGT